MKIAKKAVGLYIGTNTVDVVELKKGLLGRPKLLKSGRVTIFPEAGQVDDEKIIAAIQRVLTENDIKSKKVITAVPKEKEIIRYFKMSYLPKKERGAAVRFEAKKYIPFKLEEVISDFHIIEPKKGSKKMEVIFVAAKKEVVEHHISLLTKAGLKTSIVEASSFSLMRIFGLSGDIKKGETAVIVNVNTDSITITILKDSTIYLTRNIKMEGRQAEGEEKSTEFENLVSELQLSLDYYKKQFSKSEIDRVVLCGEAELEGWDKLLNQELKIPVVIGNPGKAIVDSDRISPQMAVASGLALQGLSRSTVGVNLVIRKEILAAPVSLISRETAKKIIFQELIVAAFLLLVVHIAMTMQVKKLNNELNEVVALRPKTTMKLAADFISRGEFAKVEKELARKELFLASLIDKRIWWTEKLSELGKLIPKEMWLDSLTIADTIGAGNKISRSLIIQGWAFSEDDKQERQLINTLVDNVREDKLFNKGIQNVNLAFIQRGMVKQVELTEFKLICASETDSPK